MIRGGWVQVAGRGWIDERYELDVESVEDVRVHKWQQTAGKRRLESKRLSKVV
jgi:hypothetical protein